MKVFNQKRKCPKCESSDISNVWYEADEGYWRRHEGGKTTEKEHIERYCRNCHYQWVEKPLSVNSKRK